MATVSGYELGAFLAVGGEEKGGSQMDRIMAEITSDVAKVADQSFGIDVRSVRIKRLNFPEQNKRAVFNRMEAERTVISQGFRAQGREEFDRLKAETDREEAELLADAKRKAAEIRGAAEAEAAKIYAEAFNADPELYEFMKSLETLESVLGEDSLIVLPHDHPLFDVVNQKPGKANDGD